MDRTTALTISAMVHIDTLGADGFIFNNGGNDSNMGYHIGWFGGQLRAELQSATEKSTLAVASPVALNVGFHHVAFTWDSVSRVMQFLCGRSTSRHHANFGGPIGISPFSTTAGGTTYNNMLDGQIDELRLYHVARSPAEIAAEATIALGSFLTYDPAENLGASDW
jgi:hypothetical protein